MKRNCKFIEGFSSTMKPSLVIYIYMIYAYVHTDIVDAKEPVKTINMLKVIINHTLDVFRNDHQSTYSFALYSLRSSECK